MREPEIKVGRVVVQLIIKWITAYITLRNKKRNKTKQYSHWKHYHWFLWEHQQTGRRVVVRQPWPGYLVGSNTC